MVTVYNPYPCENFCEQDEKMRELVPWAMVVVSVFVILQSDPTRAVLLRLSLSILAIGAYMLYMAPDVALAEAMLGSLLTTFVYILMLKSPVVMRVGYTPSKYLIEEHPWGMDGIFKELVDLFSKERGYDVEYVRFESTEDLVESFNSGYLDVACGPITDGFPILETRVYTLEDGSEKDFLSMKREDFENVKGWRKEYYGILSKKRDFSTFLKDLKERGVIREIVQKYTG